MFGAKQRSLTGIRNRFLRYCPIYSVVKYRPRRHAPTPRLSGLSCCQPNVRRQATFSKRDTESVVALAPNTELAVVGYPSPAEFGPSEDSGPGTAVGSFGGADRDRAGGLLVANQALSQLSYSPIPQLSAISHQQRFAKGR